MQNIILSFLTSLLVVIFGIPSIITVAKLKGLYDKPDFRKLHTNKIPRLGGLAIIAGFSIAISLWGISTGMDSRLQYLQKLCCLRLLHHKCRNRDHRYLMFCHF